MKVKPSIPCLRHDVDITVTRYDEMSFNEANTCWLLRTTH